MERLWAPWRMEYIQNEKIDHRCVFCVRDEPTNDADRFIVHRTPFSFVMLNRYPYTNGHLLVSPYRHTADMNDLSSEELLDLFATLRLAHNVLRDNARPEGFNIGMNLGKSAGAGVADHLHLHVVPRWNGDTNYMTVVADLRVMPENLTTTYERLLREFQKVLKEQ